MCAKSGWISDYGYDVLVFVGRALFLETQPIRLIIAELARRQVHLSASTVAHWVLAGFQQGHGYGLPPEEVVGEVIRRLALR